MLVIQKTVYWLRIIASAQSTTMKLGTWHTFSQDTTNEVFMLGMVKTNLVLAYTMQMLLQYWYPQLKG